MKNIDIELFRQNYLKKLLYKIKNLFEGSVVVALFVIMTELFGRFDLASIGLLLLIVGIVVTLCFIIKYYNTVSCINNQKIWITNNEIHILNKIKNNQHSKEFVIKQITKNKF